MRDFWGLRPGFRPLPRGLRCVHPSTACKPEPLPGGRVWLQGVRFGTENYLHAWLHILSCIRVLLFSSIFFDFMIFSPTQFLLIPRWSSNEGRRAPLRHSCVCWISIYLLSLCTINKILSNKFLHYKLSNLAPHWLVWWFQTWSVLVVGRRWLWILTTRL